MFPRSLTIVLLLGAMSAAQAQTAQTPAQTPAPAAALTPAQTDAKNTSTLETMTAEQRARLAPRPSTAPVAEAPLPTVTDGYRPTLTPPTAPGVPNATGTLPVRPAPVAAGRNCRQVGNAVQCD